MAHQESAAAPAGLLTSVLLNISATHLKLDAPLAALRYAAAAMAVESSTPKAYYRAALALDKLSGQQAAAIWCMRKAAEDCRRAETERMMSQLSCTNAPRRPSLPAGYDGDDALAALLRAVVQGGPETAAADGATSDGGEVQQAAAAKERGNELFKSGAFEAALQEYSRALDGVRRDAAGALALMGQKALLQKGGRRKLLVAARDSWAAALLDPALEAGHEGKVEALLQLGWVGEAQEACRLGIKAVGRGAGGDGVGGGDGGGAGGLDALERRVAAAGSACGEGWGGAAQPGATAGGGTTGSVGGGGSGGKGGSGGAGGSSGSGGSKGQARLRQGGKKAGAGDLASARQEAEEAARGGMSVEQLATMNEMVLRMKDGPLRRPFHDVLEEAGCRVDERVAPFHEEFRAAGRWPKDCDQQACYRALWSAFEHARALPCQLPSLNHSECIRPMDVYRRLGSNSRAAIAWLRHAPEGGVRFRPADERDYSSGALLSFGNVPNRRTVLTPGTTHVAVGFVDLGCLASACALRWVGYEASAYCVARTEVVAQMMRAGAADDCVLQAWYSAAWSRATLSAFRSALEEVLAPARSQRLPTAVLRFLQHWRTHDVPLATSRKLWLRSTTDTITTELANCKQREDRAAMCAYILTGQLLDADVGSVAMFAVPEGAGELALNSSVLQTMSAEDLFKVRLAGAPDLMAAAIKVLRARISALAGALRAGHVTVEVNHVAVTPEVKAVQAQIRALQPYSMSWSNVCDYMHPADFHALARACSAPKETVHCLHSMNWGIEVKGASCIDHLAAADGSPAAAEFVLDLVRAGERAVEVYHSFNPGWRPLLLCPPATNPRNMIDFGLALVHYEAWVKAFFGAAKLSSHGQLATVEPPTYNFMSRDSSTIFCTFTYDPCVDFQGVGGSDGLRPPQFSLRGD